MDQESVAQFLKRFGGEVRKLRQKKGFTQESFAYKANIDRSYYGAIERGERNVSLITIKKIIDTLDCNLNELANNL